MDKKDKTKALQILANISKRINASKWECLVPGCESTAINSHLLQRNGILNYIAEDDHLIQIKIKDLFKIEKEGFLDFKKLGVNQSISYPLFCNIHDTSIFKPIESGVIDFASYHTQLLFSYRALCAEIRKKEKNVELNKSIDKSNTLLGLYPKSFFDDNTRRIKGNLEGLQDLDFFKSEFEADLAEPSSRFSFTIRRFKNIPVSVSAIFSYTNNWPIGHTKFDGPLNTVFANVIPQGDHLIVIVGYHNKKTDNWINRYVENFKNCDELSQTKFLSDLIYRVETWAMAESTYQKISGKEWEKYKKDFIDKINNASYHDVYTHNLLGAFDEINA